MGVTGLLQLLKSVQRPCHVKDFKGLTLGFDAYCWLHPAVLPYALDLATGKETNRFVAYVMHRVQMLKHYGITPYVVFDGNFLPSKAHTETKRAESRDQARRKGLELLKLGKKNEAYNELQKAIDVTPEMAKCVISELKAHGIQYTVAPYEADAQLAYLEKEGIIQGIISNDSDLLVFGAKRLITKLDKFGECVEIRRDDLSSCRTVSFVGWTDDMFRTMAILTGCDYLPGLPSMGLKTAHSLVRRHKDLEKVIRVIQFGGKIRIPPGYAESFRTAESTFLHQRVFCPKRKKLVMRTEWPREDRPEDISFIGADLLPEVAVGVANGDLHPTSKQPLRTFGSCDTLAKSSPRQASFMRKETVSTPSDLKAHKKPIDSFFRPKRTPLAELDPNCFTPSPSQHDILRRAPQSVLSTPVDENGAPSRTQVFPMTASRVSGNSGPSRDNIGLAVGPSSLPNPSKRPRLCDDSPPHQRTKLLDDVNVSQSKFFTGKAPEASPSVKQRTRKQAKGGKDSFSIHCDAAVLESHTTLLGIDTEESVGKAKLGIFQDQLSANSRDQTPSILRSQASLSESQSSLSSLLTSTSSVSEASVSTEATSLSFAESAAQQSQECNAPAAGGDVEAGELQSMSRIQAFKRNAGRFGLTRTKSQPLRRESPLDRLGRQAIARSRSSSNLHRQIHDTEVDDTSETPVSQVEAPLPPPASLQRQASLRATSIANMLDENFCVPSTQGSEDMIVPNSEDDVHEEEAEDEPSKTTKISLGHFLFTGW